MTKYDLKEGRGVVFQNQKREKETHPHFNGQIMIEGVRHNIALWGGRTKKDDPYFSISISEFREKEEKPQDDNYNREGAFNENVTGGGAGGNDELPF